MEKARRITIHNNEKKGGEVQRGGAWGEKERTEKANANTDGNNNQHIAQPCPDMYF